MDQEIFSYVLFWFYNFTKLCERKLLEIFEKWIEKAEPLEKMTECPNSKGILKYEKMESLEIHSEIFMGLFGSKNVPLGVMESKLCLLGETS